MMAKRRIAEQTRPGRNEAVLQILYKTGLQLAEVAQLKMGDVYTKDGQVVDRFDLILEQETERTKPVFLQDIDLRMSLIANHLERQALAESQGVKMDSTAPLFLNDVNEAFKKNFIRKSEANEENSYYSYAELSLFIKDLHHMGGVADGTADCARRSWTMWLCLGLDGRAPLAPEFLRILRGDKRVQVTVGAIKRVVKDYDALSSQMFELVMASRVKPTTRATKVAALGRAKCA